MSLVAALVLMPCLGLFFLLGGVDIAGHWDVEKVPRPDRPMPQELKRVVDKCLFWDPKGITVADISKPFEVCFLMNADRNLIPFSGNIGKFMVFDGYWRVERAVLEIGAAELPLEVVTPQRSCWPDPIYTSLRGDMPIKPEVKGCIDISKVPTGKLTSCRAVLVVSCPQYADSKHFTDVQQSLAAPFNIVVLSDSDWALATAWSDYDCYLRTLNSRVFTRWMFAVCGALTFLSGAWFHVNFKWLRQRMDTLAVVQL